VLGLQRVAGNRATRTLLRRAGRRVLARYKTDANGNQVMDFDEDPVAFAHYSYNVVQLPKAKAPQRDNEHLTIENSLATLLIMVARAPQQEAAEYVKQRQSMKKPLHNLQSGKYDFAGMDNLNFRPVDQQPRVLPPWSPAKAKPGTTPAAKVTVDQTISLEDFLTFVKEVGRRINSPRLPPAALNRIETSIRNVATQRMGRQPSQLFLNTELRGEFLTFVAIAAELAGVAPPTDVGGLSHIKEVGLANKRQWITITPANFDENLVRGAVDPSTFERIRTRISQGQNYEVPEGVPPFNAYRTRFLNEQWNWATSTFAAVRPPAPPALVGAAS
jgi:hypothetical protein